MNRKTTTKVVFPAEETGRMLAEARKVAGFSQYEIADILGISQRSIAAYEKGKRRIHAEMLFRYAEVTKLSLDHIIGAKSSEFDGRTIYARAMKKIENLPQEEQKAVFTLVDSLSGKKVAKAS